MAAESKKMRLVFCVDSMTGGGAERATLLLAKYFSARDCQVSIVTLYGTERDFFSMPPGVTRHALGLMKNNHGIMKLIANFLRVRAIRKVIKSEEADVVVGMMTTCAVLSTVASFGLQTRSITAERNYPGRKPSIKPWGFLRGVFYRFADAHIVQSKETAAWLERHTGAKNTYIIPNAVSWPLQSFPPSVDPASLLSSDSKLLLAVGTKPGQKGFDILLQAFAPIADAGAGWKLAIIGLDVDASEDADVAALVEIVDRLGIAESVIFPGRIGNVADWYERADLFVLSSRYEGFPNVLLEAMAAGCAPVAFDCDTGPRDIIRHGENGLLVEPESADELARAMQTLMHDEALRQRFAESATAVRQTFSEEKVFCEWEKVINEV